MTDVLAPTASGSSNSSSSAMPKSSSKVSRSIITTVPVTRTTASGCSPSGAPVAKTAIAGPLSPAMRNALPTPVVVMSSETSALTVTSCPAISGWVAAASSSPATSEVSSRSSLCVR